jgi:hypothetical protein
MKSCLGANHNHCFPVAIADTKLRHTSAVPMSVADYTSLDVGPQKLRKLSVTGKEQMKSISNRGKAAVGRDNANCIPPRSNNPNSKSRPFHYVD